MKGRCQVDFSYNQDSFHKEVDLIQGCITRMSQNSFLVKGWLISIISVAMTFLPEDFNGWFVIGFLVIISFAFWYLDAYFLNKERLYREKYSWVIQVRLEGNQEHVFDLDPDNENMSLNGFEKESIWKVMRSDTLKVFYGIILAILLPMLIVYPIVEGIF